MANHPNPRTWHRAEADHFADLIDSVLDWAAPTPVAEWSVVDLLAHILVWWPSYFAAGGVPLPDADPNDLAGSFWRQAVAIDELLADDERVGASFVGPDGIEQTLGGALAFYVADLYLHGWDLARASGQDATMDEPTAELLLTGMIPVSDSLRASGRYGPIVEVPAHAPASDRLIGFIGRDPNWSPSED